MNDERLRWALEQIESGQHVLAEDRIAAWALGRLPSARLDREYADHFKLKADR